MRLVYLDMDAIGAFDAKTNLGKLLDRVEMGETVVITRHGRPVARLGPIADETARHDRRCAAMKRLLQRGARSAGKFDWAEWKTYRDEGRR